MLSSYTANVNWHVMLGCYVDLAIALRNTFGELGFDNSKFR